MKSNERAPASSASQGTTIGSSQSPGGNYAFLVHSQDSISQFTPPNIDNHHLARQKRRRTRYQLYNIEKKNVCLLIASAALKTKQSSKLNMSETPSLTKLPESILSTVSSLEKKRYRSVQARNSVTECYSTRIVGYGLIMGT